MTNYEFHRKKYGLGMIEVLAIWAAECALDGKDIDFREWLESEVSE